MSSSFKQSLKLLNPQKIKMSKKKSYSYLTLSAFIGAFSSYFFVLAANLYSPGLGGISSGISYTINDIIWANGGQWMSSRTSADSMIYWLIYIICNIPIIYLATRWFSKRFLTYSLYFFIVNFMISMVFANLNSLSGGLINLSDPSLSKEVVTITILLFSFLGGLASGVSVGIAFKVGACTMGLDPVVKHISRERNINIGPILSMVAATTTTFFVVIRSFIPSTPGGMSPFKEEGFLKSTFFSAEYIGSWLFIVAYSVVASAVYSSTKKVEVVATSIKTDEISDYLNNSAYHRGHTILHMEGGYSREIKKAIKMIINYDEMYDVVEKIAAIDHKAFITIKEIFKVYDIHDWKTMTDEDKEKERLLFIKKEKKRMKMEKQGKDQRS